MSLNLPAGVQVNAPIKPGYETILTADALADVFEEGGVAAARAVAPRGSQPLVVTAIVAPGWERSNNDADAVTASAAGQPAAAVGAGARLRRRTSLTVALRCAAAG